jgi:hypothetical protein
MRWDQNHKNICILRIFDPPQAITIIIHLYVQGPLGLSESESTFPHEYVKSKDVEL